MAQKQKIYIPTYISSIDYKPARVLPHVYFWNGMRETDTFYVQSYASGSNKNSITASAFEQFPYFDNYNVVAGETFPSTGSLSLLFNNEVAQYGTASNNSLYSEYWSSYVNLLYNPRTRLVDCSAIIPLADYFKMELNDIVEWRGNYYHLRAINDYNLSNGECQLQLLGPILSDTISSIFGGSCDFGFSSNVYIPATTTTTTTAGPTTTTTSTTTTIAPTTTTTTSTTTTSTSTTTTTAGPTTTTTTLNPTFNVQYLLVAGGGGGGFTIGGGGGAGGFVYNLTGAPVTAGNSYAIVVGAGGAVGSNGGISTGLGFGATGGGAGGSSSTVPAANGKNGGSGGGGGGAYNNSNGGLSDGTGYSGGKGYTVSGQYQAAGGGGGANNPGSGGSTIAPTKGGNGGLAGNTAFGPLCAAGGGGGYSGVTTGTLFRGGTGGSSLGGNGAWDARQSATDGVVNTGSGGGGGCNATYTAGNGSSGIVVLRYLGTARATGGTITYDGTYTTHTFTSSGTFTVTI